MTQRRAYRDKNACILHSYQVMSETAQVWNVLEPINKTVIVGES